LMRREATFSMIAAFLLVAGAAAVAFIATHMGSVAWAAEGEGGGSGGGWKIIVVLACFWLVILAAILLNVYRIRRRERREEEAGVEFKGKEL